MVDASNREESRRLLRDRGSRFLDFLSAAAKSTIQPQRTLNRQRKESTLILSTDIPQMPGAVTVGPSESNTAWLTVKAIQPPQSVSVPAELREYIDARSIRRTTDTPRLNQRFDELLNQERNISQQPLINRGEPEELRARITTIQHRFVEWRSTTWEQWKADNVQRERASDLYRHLFELYSRPDRDPDTDELVFGHCLLTWHGRYDVSYPLIVTPAHMVFEEGTGTMRVEAAGPTRMSTAPVNGIDLLGFDLLERLQDSFNGDPADVWDEAERAALEQDIATRLGPDTRISPELDLRTTDSPELHQGWVLFLRTRVDTRDLFYRNLSRRLQDDDYLLPVAFSSLFSDAGTLRMVTGGTAVDDGSADRLLMPLPSNAEQKRIAKQLAISNGVTVQGPPGTGKSHTIVNLVSHLLAQGKRILVTAEKEQALVVLRDKIPEEIRDLVVASVGNTTADNDQLRLSVQRMQDSLSNLDEEFTAFRIGELERSVDKANHELGRIDDLLVNRLALSNQRFDLVEGSWAASETARWVKANTRFAIIPDAVAVDAKPPLTVEEFNEFVTLCRTLDDTDVHACLCDVPDAEQYPSGAGLDKLYSEQRDIADRLDQLVNAGLDMSAVDAVDDAYIDGVIQRAKKAKVLFASHESGWESKFDDYIHRNPRQCNRLSQELAGLGSDLGRCIELSQSVRGHIVDAPEGDPHVQLGLVERWRLRLERGKRTPPLFDRPLREFYDSVKIDGYQPHDAEHLGIIADFITLRHECGILTAKIDQTLTGLPVPQIDIRNHSLSEAEDTLQRIEDVLNWWRDIHPGLERDIRRFLPQSPDASASAVSLDKAIAVLEAAKSRRRRQRVAVKLNTLKSALRSAARKDASPLYRELHDALARRDASAWQRALDEAARLNALMPSVRRRQELYDRLHTVAPQWAMKILTSHGDEVVTGPVAEFPTIWEVGRAGTWIRDIAARSNVDALLKQSRQITDSLHRNTLKLISLSARLHLKRSQDPDDRRALNTWLAAIRKYGKGTGKNAARHLATARRELPKAMNAMPVWIMPLHRVLENFDPMTSHPFDVIIVDESSQCGLLSVGALALADKAIVVGDDKQTSPSRPFQREDIIIGLQERYLYDFPDKSLFTIEESLYAMANRTFESPIMLREHFRCVPEIIGYCNRFYGGQIVPLRERTHPEIGAPLQDRYLAAARSQNISGGNVNYAEADAIAAQIKACCDDPRYAGMTFGVVTMMSGPQQRVINDKVIEAIGAAEYADRKIRVGNPPAFQGDERNVVFLSLVTDASSPHAYVASLTRDDQWYNVAVSRAQDQLWVFHSMNQASLSDNDRRKGLIEYVQVGFQEEDHDNPLECARTDFEKDIVRQLAAHGYASNVRMHYRVGRYEIDCVITLAPGMRLAVECDGDEEIDKDGFIHAVERQRVLERLGWHIIRLSAPTYYLDPDEALAPVWRALDELSERYALVGQSPVSVDAPQRFDMDDGTASREDWKTSAAPGSHSDAALQHTVVAKTVEQHVAGHGEIVSATAVPYRTQRHKASTGVDVSERLNSGDGDITASYGLHCIDASAWQPPSWDGDEESWAGKTALMLVRRSYPINFGQLCEWIIPELNRHGFDMAASRQLIRIALEQLEQGGDIQLGTDKFYYPREFGRNLTITLGRSVNNISHVEFAAVMYRICLGRPDMEKTVIFKRMCRLYRFRVMNPKIEYAFDGALAILIRSHLVTVSGTKVSPTGRPASETLTPQGFYGQFLQ